MNPVINPYLVFEYGNNNKAKGRAIFYIKDVNTAIFLNVNGTALKEKIYEEIISGRLVVPEMFEPLYLTVSNLDKKLSFEELEQLAKLESRDLITLPLNYEKINKDIALEEAKARYITICKEVIYLRLIKKMVNEIFHKNKTSIAQSMYVNILKLVEFIYEARRSRRNEDEVELDYFLNLIEKLKDQIPFLNFKTVICALKSGDIKQWHSMADYIDSYFVSLKKFYPLLLENNVILTINKETEDWISKGMPQLYFSYFLALFDEKYEQAKKLKQRIKSNFRCYTKRT